MYSFAMVLTPSIQVDILRSKNKNQKVHNNTRIKCNIPDILTFQNKILAAELQTKFWGCFSWIWESNRRHRRLMETKESIRRWGNLGDDGIIQRRSIGDKGIQRRLQDSLSIEFFLLLYLYYIIYKGMSNNILYIGQAQKIWGLGKKFWGLSSFISRPRKRGETIHPHL